MKRIGVLVVAHNASATLASVLSRIPEDFRSRVSDVVICDDHSEDATYLIGLGYQRLASALPITVVRSGRGLGYGGNQKVGLRWVIEHGLDIVVLLHGDGHYAPEALPEMVAPLERGEADAVLGSRMLEPGAARRGGMPRHRYVGNRLLTALQNAMVGTHLSEWHSGFRSYSVAALRDLPFDQNSDGFDFDTELLIQLCEANKRIVEIAVPSFSGDELRNARGVAYAKDVLVDSARYRLHRIGVGSGELAFASDSYELKITEDTSHGRILEWLKDRPASRVLDLGCADGTLGEQLRSFGHRVTGVDVVERVGVRGRVDKFVIGDLEQGIPPDVGREYDVVVAADVIEHVRAPEGLLAEILGRLRPGGSVIVSIPNFAHWYPRLRVAFGAFDYDRRGILDRGHLRFFTRRSFERLVGEAGCRIARRDAVGIPVEVIGRGGAARAPSLARWALQRLDALSTTLRPTLFAYQFLYELRPLLAQVERTTEGRRERSAAADH